MKQGLSPGLIRDYNKKVRIFRAASVAAAVCIMFVSSVTVSRAVTFIQGASLSASNFRVLDTQHSAFGGTASSSSSNFRLLGAFGDVAIGSSSATSFGLRSGFLYFPLAVAPALTAATAGDGQVSLTWTTATLDVGFSISGYNVCTKPSSGSFTCEDVGNVTSFVKSGLTNGTSHAFKVQVKESFANVVAESGQLSATPSAAATPTPTPAAAPAGGGFVLPPSPSASLRIHGYAYPGATITLLQDGILIETMTGASDGGFDFLLSDMTPGTYTFGLWAEDIQNRRSVMFSIPLAIIGATENQVSNIVIAPTIEMTTPAQRVQGEAVELQGAATPNSTVRVRIMPGDREFTVGATALGTYAFSGSTDDLEGSFFASARIELTPAAVSPYSQLLPFTVAITAPTPTPTPPLVSPIPTPEVEICPGNADINDDGRVNFIDFSIMAFWFKRSPLPPKAPFDINCDGQVLLDDFSRLAFFWTG